MKKLFIIALLSLYSTVSLAGYGTAAANAFSKSSTSASGYAMNAGKGAQAANGAYNMSANVSMAGRTINMPASAALAANAAQFALSAARLTPATFVVGAMASWLLTKGLTYANDQWIKSISTSIYRVPSNNGHPVFEGTESEIAAWAQGKVFWVNGGSLPAGSNPTVQNLTGDSNSLSRHLVSANYGNIINLGLPISNQSSSVPATESDFATAASSPLPDAVAQQFYDAGQPLPIQKPALNPTPVDQPLGEPYVDPRTGKTVQPKVRVIPDPTVDDPFRVRVEPYNMEVAPAPTPVPGEPAPLPLDEQPKDPCLENPDRIGCLQVGTPEDSTLETKAIPMLLTPVSVGGAGSCPAPKNFSAMGKQMIFSYQPICTGATLMRPVVLALAWLIAAYIVVGSLKES